MAAEPTNESLGTALPKEMARVRDEILPMYLEIGPAGLFAAMNMREALDQAARAMISGDVMTMILAYERLKGFNA